MKTIEKLIKLYDNACIWIWVKTENVRLKAEELTYKMNDKLKER